MSTMCENVNSYPTEFNPMKDILFAKSRGNIHHHAQKIYRQTVDDIFDDYIKSNKARLYMQFKRNESLILQAKIDIHEKLGNDCRFLSKSQTSNDWKLLSDEKTIDQHIWDSIKRKKSTRRKNDIKERALLDMLSSSGNNTNSFSTDKPSSQKVNSTKKNKKRLSVIEKTKTNNKRVRKTITSPVKKKRAKTVLSTRKEPRSRKTLSRSVKKKTPL